MNDINYMIRTAAARPIGNIYLGIDGTAYMLAAGAANTAGKGGPVTMSRGTVGIDHGNTTTWAIEAANNGTGQPWPPGPDRRLLQDLQRTELQVRQPADRPVLSQQL